MHYIKAFIFSVYKFLIQFAYLFPYSKPWKKKKQDVIIWNPDSFECVDAEITRVFNNKQGIVTIISDDGEFNTGKALKRLSDQYNLPITVAGTVRNVAKHLSFWKKAQKDHLFECVNHSYNHIRMDEASPIAKNRKCLMHEIIHSGKYFERVLKRPSISFVCPENKMCKKGYEIIQKSELYATTKARKGFEYNSLNPDSGIQPGNWFNLGRIGILDTSDEEERKKWIDAAAKQGKWLIEIWHNVSENTSSGFQTISPETAEKHLQNLSEKKDEVWIALFTDAVKYIYERQDATVKAFIQNESIHIIVELNELPKGIFDQDLSVKIDCSSEEFDKYTMDWVFEKENRYLLVNVTPGIEKIVFLH